MTAHLGPRPVTNDSGPWLLHDAARSRQVEALALTHRVDHSLMQSAGLAVARMAMALAPHGRHVHVLAGPGNNGGDGLVAATHLHAAGRSVSVHLLGDVGRMPPDARHALAQAQAAGVEITGSIPPPNAPCELIIDALLGLGISRAPQGSLAEAIRFSQSSSAPVLAVDLPSGLHADTGQPMGLAVRADATLALLTLKPGLFTAQGKDHAGAVWIDTLGCDDTGVAGTARVPGAHEVRQAWPMRRHAQHKGSFGDLVVVGGASGMTGAALLAAQAALAAGAGRVYASLLDDAAPSCWAQQPELMGRKAWWLAAPPTLARSTVVCGCGGGQGVRQALPALIGHVAKLVLDADALNVVAADVAMQQLLGRRADRGLPTVLTPHPLEAARLLGNSASDIQADRLAAAQTLSDRFRCVVVLKGSGTVVAAPGALPSINLSGNALLATPGTGDVLAGWIGGTWSAGTCDAALAAEASVWLHGLAADQAFSVNPCMPLQASRLIEAMRHALPRWSSRTPI